MKRIFAVGCLLILVNLHAFSQNGFEFKYNFKPNKIYTQTIDLKENTEILYLGDSAFNAKLKQHKLQKQQTSEDVQHFETIISTDSLVHDSIFKLTLEFIKTLENNNPILSSGTKLFAHCNTVKFQPFVDSVSVLAKSKNNDQAIIEISKSAILNIDFPKTPLSIGKSFFKTYPVPIALSEDVQFIVNVGTGYKLLSIDNGIALFEIKQIYKINLGQSKIPATITGEGKGNLLFDMNENYYTKYELNTKLIYKVKKEKYTVQNTTSTTLKHQIVISKK